MRTGPLLRNIAIFAVLFGIVIFLVGKVRMRDEEAAPAAVIPTQGEKEPQTEARRIQLLGPSTVSRRNAAGESVWEAGIRGDWQVDEGGKRIAGGDVDWRIVGPDLEPLQVTAGRFQADEASDTVRFAENVNATLPSEDATFTATEAQYNPVKQQLSADGNVVLRWGKMLVTGEQLTADMVAHKIQVRGKVKMTYEG
jgi:hypothetical protein